MKRRAFITLLGGAAVAWPLTGRAQQPAMPVVGILAVAAPEANAIRLRAFREGLGTAGYVEGQNVKIEYRWVEAHTGRLPELAAGLVRDRVTVLVAAGGIASAVAAKAATREIPIEGPKSRSPAVSRRPLCAIVCGSTGGRSEERRVGEGGGGGRLACQERE